MVEVTHTGSDSVLILFGTCLCYVPE